MKTLLVLRHAKSSWDNPSLDDHERPLNGRGRTDAARVGVMLKQRRLTPDLIISSDAVRASMTAEAVAEAAGDDGEIVRDSRLYLAGPRDVAAVLRAVRERDSDTLMLVGHNPGLEELVHHLTGEAQPMPTAALAQIEIPIERWRELTLSTRGRLVSVWRPKEQS